MTATDPAPGCYGAPDAEGPGAGDEVAVDVEVEDEAWLEALPDAPALALQAAEAVLRGFAAGGVVVLLTDDATLRDLNHRFRGRDAPTNVLAFPAGPFPEGVGHTISRRVSLGDIALAFGVCACEARAQGKALADHLRHLVAHGVLHLLGYDHQEEDEARVMEDAERRILAGIEVADPYAGELAPSFPDPRSPDPHAHDHVAKDTSRHVP
jgi:probable rRNA maturation factor